MVPVSLGRAGQSGHELGLGLQLPPAGRKSKRGSRSRGTVGMPTGSARLLERPGRAELVKLGELAPVVGAPGGKVLSRSPRPGGEEFEPLRPTPALTLGILGRPHCRALLLSPCTVQETCGCPGLRCPCASFSAPPAPAQHLLLQEASLGPQGPQLRPGMRLPTFPWDETAGHLGQARKYFMLRAVRMGGDQDAPQHQGEEEWGSFGLEGGGGEAAKVPGVDQRGLLGLGLPRHTSLRTGKTAGPQLSPQFSGGDGGLRKLSDSLLAAQGTGALAVQTWCPGPAHWAA